MEVSHYHTDLGEYSITGKAITNLPLHKALTLKISLAACEFYPQPRRISASLAHYRIFSSLRFFFSMSHANSPIVGVSEMANYLLYSSILG